MRKNLLLILGIICQFFLLSKTVSASGLTLKPAFQTISTDQSSSASIEISNPSSSSANLVFSLATIHATDLYGRLQFNAPLPQTIQEVSTESAQINPSQKLLTPGEKITVIIDFNPEKLAKGSNNFLFLAEVSNHSSINSNSQQLRQFVGATISVNHDQNQLIKLELKELKWDYFPVIFRFPDSVSLILKNSGNINSTPRGVIQIYDIFNREVARGALNDKSLVVVPGSQRIITGNINSVGRTPPLMMATMKLYGYDSSKTSPFNVERTFMYLNPLLGAAIVPLIAIAVILKKRRSQSN